jgi:hypothetical protein
VSLFIVSQLGVALALAQTGSVGPSYLSRADVVAALADGKSWAMSSADGRNGRIRFNADGTGEIESPIKRRIKWTIDGNTFCMRMGFMLGTRCFQATRSTNTVQGYSNGKPSVRFTR